MKKTPVNKISHPGRGRIIVASVGAVILLAILAVGYGKLRELYLEQCVIRTMDGQVFITAGKMVRPNVIAEEFGLKPNANLALIDFAERREHLLRKIPTLKSITIRRQLPDKVYLVATERTPVAKLNVLGNRTPTGRVTDEEGVVFLCHRDTQNLPTIREPKAKTTAVAHRLEDHARAALQLLAACREPALGELKVLEIDASRRDFLLMTIGDYSRAKICWEGMDEPETPASRADLVRRLTHLQQAIRSQVTQGVVIWNATMPDAVYADTQRLP